MERRGKKTARRTAGANGALGRRPAGLFGATFGVLVAVALAVSQLAGVAHLALVRHARCEHGALVHVTHAPRPAHALSMAGSRAPQTRASQARRSEPRVAGAPGAAGQHEHCTEVGLRSALVAVRQTCVAPQLLAERALGWRVHRRPGARAVALLALAPKSSPPA